jgi:hypothetical protein
VAALTMATGALVSCATTLASIASGSPLRVAVGVSKRCRRGADGPDKIVPNSYPCLAAGVVSKASAASLMEVRGSRGPRRVCGTRVY